MTPDVNVVIDHSEYTILVVDDVVSNVLLLRVLLTNEKFKVITASNGKEALSQAANAHPDLILLDVMMPEMNGFEVAERLKADPETQNIPIIFLTALNTTADIVKGFKVGANDFISKPFNKEELVIRVNHQISLIAAKRIILRQTEELRKTIMGRDKLYSVIAHDLRSPMGSIKMVLNMLILSLPEEQIGAEMFQMLSMANQSTEDVFALLDNLLKWTKSQIGKLNVVYQDFDVVENVASVIEIFNLVAAVKNIKLSFSVQEKIEVHADIDMIKTIMRNLLSNAIKFSYNDSEILVKAVVEGDMAIISVTDSGKGMSEEDQKKLLNAETHFSKYGTNNEEGSGLGLLLCLDFAQKNGGRLWFESEEGKGSTFFFSVPLNK
ncbi:response regulator [Bacteroidaceae bacterium]|jgi:two-component system sensor histidine kinase/response regulator